MAAMLEPAQIIAPLGELHWAVRNWAFLAIGITLASLLAFVVLLLAKYVRICLNIFTDTHPPAMMLAPGFRPPDGEETWFRSFDGTALKGMLLHRAKGKKYKGSVIFCHEFAADMRSCDRYVRPLIDAGFDVFTFDFRCHGDSSSPARYKPLQWPSDKELEDVLGACAHVEALLEARGRPAEIGLFGISRGAGAALLAASSDPSVKAIICDGAFSTAETLIALMKRWASIFARVKLVYENHPDAFWRFMVWVLMRFAQPKLGRRFLSVSRALREMRPRPILFIHGQRDSYIREEQTRLLYAKAPSPKYLWLVEEAKHNQSVVVAPREYAARTVAFFRRHLADEQVAATEITSPAETEVA
jgi:pimeloyl-ACP methyl ester carboxylesterase